MINKCDIFKEVQNYLKRMAIQCEKILLMEYDLLKSENDSDSYIPAKTFIS